MRTPRPSKMNEVVVFTFLERVRAVLVRSRDPCTNHSSHIDFLEGEADFHSPFLVQEGAGVPLHHSNVLTPMKESLVCADGARYLGCGHTSRYACRHAKLEPIKKGQGVPVKQGAVKQ